MNGSAYILFTNDISIKMILDGKAENAGHLFDRTLITQSIGFYPVTRHLKCACLWVGKTLTVQRIEHFLYCSTVYRGISYSLNKVSPSKTLRVSKAPLKEAQFMSDGIPGVSEKPTLYGTKISVGVCHYSEKPTYTVAS